MAKRSSGISLKLDGFDDIIKQLNLAESQADHHAKELLTQCAEIAESELISEAQAKGVKQDIIDEVKTEIEGGHARYTAHVGWKLGEYDPRNPSKGYIAVFENYGTVKRKTAKGKNRGALTAKNFIKDANKSAKKKIKKLQDVYYAKMLGGLKK